MSKQIQTKSVPTLLDETSLDNSFVLGYYGGGNYGDELLLEVMQHLFKQRDYTTISFLYQKPAAYGKFHENLGYEPIDAASKPSIIKTMLRRKNLVIGGGGLWGLDVNLNIVLMSCMLLVARRILGKNVYLVGVGYYGSTGRMGHFAAWLAGKAASQILARDPESHRNFLRLNQHTYLTDDIAFNLPDIIQVSNAERSPLEAAMENMKGNVTLVSLRRFKPNQANQYVEALETWLTRHPKQSVILALMEPRKVDPDGYELLMRWQRERSGAAVVDFSYNPLALYEFFLRYSKRLSFIGPQFHVQLVAHLAGVRLLPLVYDNKVAELLRKLEYANPIAISDITPEAIETFVSSQGRA